MFQNPPPKAFIADASGNFNISDNKKINLGDGSDLQIYHSVDGLVDNSTNDLFIRNLANDKDIIIQTDNGSGSTTTYFRADGSTGAVELSHYGSTKIATTSTGVTVTGNVAVTGTVDGRDVAADGTKLDGIEASADVTDDANVGAALTGFSTGTDAASDDLIPIYDVSASAWKSTPLRTLPSKGRQGQRGNRSAGF